MSKATLIIFDGQGQPMSITEQTIPLLEPGEISAKKLYTNICRSDLNTYSGLRDQKMLMVLGYEIVEEIIAFSKRI